MTIYIRPLSLELNQRVQRDFQATRATPEALIVSILQKKEGKLTLWYEFDLMQFKVQEQKVSSFVGFAVGTPYIFRLKHKDTSGVNQIDKSIQAQIDLNQWIEDFQGSKRDLFTKAIKLREYQLIFQYKYNKFVQVCARTFKEKKSVQQQLAQGVNRVEGIKRLDINTASRGKLNIVEERKDLKYKPSIPKKVQQKDIQRINTQKLHIVEENKDLKYQPSIPKKFQQKRLQKIEIQPNQKTEALLPRQKIQFYQGECKHKNLFSCLDPSNELRDERQFTILEQAYQTL